MDTMTLDKDMGKATLEKAIEVFIVVATRVCPISPPLNPILDISNKIKPYQKQYVLLPSKVVGEKITELGGKMDIKMAPKAVSQMEESELAAMMERLAMENQETDGDALEKEDAYE